MTQCHERGGGTVTGSEIENMHSKVRLRTEMLGPGGHLRKHGKDCYDGQGHG